MFDWDHIIDNDDITQVWNAILQSSYTHPIPTRASRKEINGNDSSILSKKSAKSDLSKKKGRKDLMIDMFGQVMEYIKTKITLKAKILEVISVTNTRPKYNINNIHYYFLE